MMSIVALLIADQMKLFSSSISTAEAVESQRSAAQAAVHVTACRDAAVMHPSWQLWLWLWERVMAMV